VRAALLVCGLLVGTAPSRATPTDAGAPETPIPALPLLVRVATEAGQPVVGPAWVTARVAEADALLGAEGVHVREAAREALDSPHARLETRADRDALARMARPGVVNVFVVALLRDVDDGVTLRRGVHWRLGVETGARIVILSALAGEGVLAHELGHYLGLPHTAIADDVMSYVRAGGALAFRVLGGAQGVTLRARARAAFRARELE